MDVDVSAVTRQLTDGAAAQGLMVWEDFPRGGPIVDWPTPDVTGFLEAGHRLQARVLYLLVPSEADDGPDAVVAAFAVDGVLHRFGAGDWQELLLRHSHGASCDFTQARDWAEDGDDGEDEEYMGWWEDTYRQLPDRLRQVVDALIADHRYDGRHGSAVAMAEHAAGLPADEYSQVKSVAPRVFDHRIGNQLNLEAERLAPRVVALDGFEPLWWNEQIAQFATERLHLTDPRLATRIAFSVQQLTGENGMRDAAEQRVRRLAATILGQLPMPVRDRLGFTKRAEQRDALLAPFIAEHPEHVRGELIHLVVRFDEEQHTATREARYATAGRALRATGMNKTATATKLGISTGVLDRLVGTYPDDVDLLPGDPLLEVLPTPSATATSLFG